MCPKNLTVEFSKYLNHSEKVIFKAAFLLFGYFISHLAYFRTEFIWNFLPEYFSKLNEFDSHLQILIRNIKSSFQVDLRMDLNRWFLWIFLQSYSWEIRDVLIWTLGSIIWMVYIKIICCNVAILEVAYFTAKISCSKRVFHQK